MGGIQTVQSSKDVLKVNGQAETSSPLGSHIAPQKLRGMRTALVGGFELVQPQSHMNLLCLRNQASCPFWVNLGTLRET